MMIMIMTNIIQNVVLSKSLFSSHGNNDDHDNDKNQKDDDNSNEAPIGGVASVHAPQGPACPLNVRVSEGHIAGGVDQGLALALQVAQNGVANVLCGKRRHVGLLKP